MARLLVLWGTPQDPDFFERHYREIHVPLVKKLPGCLSRRIRRRPRKTTAHC